MVRTSLLFSSRPNCSSPSEESLVFFFCGAPPVSLPLVQFPYYLYADHRKWERARVLFYVQLMFFLLMYRRSSFWSMAVTNIVPIFLFFFANRWKDGRDRARQFSWGLRSYNLRGRLHRRSRLEKSTQFDLVIIMQRKNFWSRIIPFSKNSPSFPRYLSRTFK